MPLTRPISGETRQDWVSRCMSNEQYKLEFPDDDQRLAVCHTTWRDAHPNSNCSQVIINLSATEHRYEMLENKQHLVVPVIMMVEGIYHNNVGRMLYLQEEFSKNPHFWNGSPVPVFHPDDNGQSVSCNSPEFISERTVGRVFNSYVEEGKLKAEIWIDVAKANQVDPTLVPKVLSGQAIDVSTGHFSEDEEASGEWKGNEYDAVVRNIYPDHLAILPGQTGACSWEDGCGIRANKKGGETVVDIELTQEANEMVDNIVSKVDDEKKRSWVRQKLASLARKVGLTKPKANEVSQMDILSELRTIVDSMDTTTNPQYHYVRDVYDDYFIYEKTSEDGSMLFRQGYSANDDGEVSLVGEPVEVKEEREYVEINIENNEEVTSNMTRQELVTQLIANDKSTFVEANRKFLEGLDEASFETVSNIHVEMEKRFTKNAEEENSEEEENREEEEGESNEETSANSFIESAPKEIQEVLKNGLSMVNDKRKKLAEKVLAVKGNQYTETELQEMPIDGLEKIAALVKIEPNFSGRGGHENEHVAAANERQSDGSGVPDMPAVNFKKAS